MQAPENEKQFRTDFGLRLREAIEKSRFPYHKDFREEAGIADGTLKNWLNGTFMPGVYDLKRLSTLLGVDMLWLGFGIGHIGNSQETFRQLLTRNHEAVTRVLSEVRQFATQKGLTDDTAAKMLIDYLDNELHPFEEKQVKAS